MKNFTKEESKNIILVLVNLVGGRVGCFETCSLSFEDSNRHCKHLLYTYYIKYLNICNVLCTYIN
jgi:hypothetical protein